MGLSAAEAPRPWQAAHDGLSSKEWIAVPAEHTRRSQRGWKRHPVGQERAGVRHGSWQAAPLPGRPPAAGDRPPYRGARGSPSTARLDIFAKPSAYMTRCGPGWATTRDHGDEGSKGRAGRGDEQRRRCCRHSASSASSLVGNARGRTASDRAIMRWRMPPKTDGENHTRRWDRKPTWRRRSTALANAPAGSAFMEHEASAICFPIP